MPKPYLLTSFLKVLVDFYTDIVITQFPLLSSSSCMQKFFLSVSSFFAIARLNKQETISICLVTVTTHNVQFRKWMKGPHCYILERGW